MRATASQGVARLRSALAAMAAAIIVTAASVVVVASASPSARMHESQRATGGLSNATCTFSSNSTCVIAAAGTSWTTDSPDRWCTVTNSTVVTTPNGSFVTHTVYCVDRAVMLSFLVPVDALIKGVVNLSEPTQVWVLPTADNCFEFASLAHSPFSCPPPFGTIPPYTWNASTSVAGELNLTGLELSLGAAQGIIPAGTSWSLWFVDSAPGTEDVNVTTSIALVPAS